MQEATQLTGMTSVRRQRRLSRGDDLVRDCAPAWAGGCVTGCALLSPKHYQSGQVPPVRS